MSEAPAAPASGTRSAPAARAGALLALWNDVDPALEPAYNDWHAKEHVPERLAVPGFLWARRYGRDDARAAGLRYLTLYGLASAQVLDEAPYQKLLREPTPKSALMRPALLNISRWVCRVHTEADLERGTHLALWVNDGDLAGDGPARRCRVAMPESVGLLVASRLADAAPLSWMRQGQAGAKDTEEGGAQSGWLEAVSFDPASADPAQWAEAQGDLELPVVYRRLPVG